MSSEEAFSSLKDVKFDTESTIAVYKAIQA